MRCPGLHESGPADSRAIRAELYRGVNHRSRHTAANRDVALAYEEMVEGLCDLPVPVACASADGL